MEGYGCAVGVHAREDGRIGERAARVDLSDWMLRKVVAASEMATVLPPQLPWDGPRRSRALTGPETPSFSCL